jgi:neutral ceramidase
MLVGSAWEDITPNRPVALLGQMHVRLGRYTHDPLTVNAVVFDDGEERVAVVSIDVCVLPDGLISTLQQACAAASDIEASNLLIAATHTHVAPCTTDQLAGDPDPEFMARLEAAVVQAVGSAIANREECTLFAGAGYLEQMGWNRRGMRRDGSCHMYWGSWREDFVGIEGPRDGEVGVIFARKADGQVKAVVTSFSTHPNCVEGESYYSADLPGQVRKVLRGALAEEVGVVYLTGAAADTAPSLMENNLQNTQPWRGEAGLVRSGLYLGGEILKVIAEQVIPMPQPHVRHTQIRIDIPMRQWDAWADLSGFQGGMLDYFEQSRADWPRLLQSANPVPVSLHVLRLGEAAICFNPAELYVQFGLAIKKESPAAVTLLAQLTNGWCGYVPTPEAIRHGGYSATSASHTRLVAEAGWMMVEHTRKLLAQAFDARVVASTPANSLGK